MAAGGARMSAVPSLEQRAARMQDPVRLVPVELDDLAAATLQPPRFVIRPLVPRGVVTLLGGHGGAGKSVLGLTLAAHVAAGAHTWAGLPIEDGRALFCSLEDGGELIRHRLRQIAEVYGLDASKIARRLRVLDGSDAAAALAGELNDLGIHRLVAQPAMEELAEAAQGCALVVVDNASDAFDAGENDRRLVRAFLRMLTRIARDVDAGLVLLAHIDKQAARNGAQGNSYSGSTAWHNSARSRLALVEEDGAVQLRQEKLNLGRRADPIALAWSDAGVLVPAERSTDVREDDREAVLGAIRAAAAAGIDITTSRTGTTTQAALSLVPELPDRLRGPRGRLAFWSALDGLVSERKIQPAEVRGTNRHPRQVWIESARALSPIPPMSERARLGSAAPACVDEASAERARASANCPACDGEGCPHCVRPKAA